MDYKKLKVWNKSMELVLDIYKMTEVFPAEEKYGLISQMRRCAVSIPSNIAEGKGRRSDKSLINFLKISLGSLFELETQLLICENLNILKNNKSGETFKNIIGIRKMIYSLIKNIS